MMAVQIKDILGKIVEGSAGMPRVLQEFRVAGAWGKVNPANVIENATPDKCTAGVLYVTTKNSTWAQQINILKSEIILKMNTFLGENIVNDIRVKVGPLGEAAVKIREKPKKNCGDCGVEYFGDETLCPACSRQTKQNKGIELQKLVQRNPKVRLEDARRFISDIADTDMHRAKRDVMARKADQNYREGRKRGGKKAN